MKKLIPLLLLMSLILSGCVRPIPPKPTIPPEPPAQTEPIPETVPKTDLLDGKTLMGTDPNLYFVNNPEIDALGTFSDLLIYKDYLLLTHLELPQRDPYPEGEPNWEEPGEPIPMDILLIDLQTGALHARTQLQMRGGPTVHLAGNYIVAGSWELGTLTILDEDLQIVKQAQIEPSWSLNHIDASGRYAYSVPEYRALVQTDLNTGKETVLLADALNLSVDSVDVHGASLNYVDAADHRFHSLYLDFATNQLTPMPFPGSYAYASCMDGLWLADMRSASHAYLMGRDQDPYVLKSTGTMYELIDGPAPIYGLDTTDSYQQHLTLYREDGSFFRETTGDADIGFYSRPLWCAARNGYFLSALTMDDSNRLLFWDTEPLQTGESLEMRRLSTIDWEGNGAETVAQELYDKAQVLSDRYSIDVRIADQCATEYNNYVVYPVIDYFVIDGALDTLERVLSAFPEGFIPQLQYGDMGKTQINLMGQLNAQDVPGDADGFTEFAGFVSRQDGRQVMVVNIILSDLEQTLYHEFSHMIDSRLEFGSRYRETLYTESRWESLNPEGFQYSNDCYYIPQEYATDGFDNTFIDTYGRTNATEDRARVFEYASVGNTWAFDPEFYGPLREKLAYYSACIRDGFDSTGWPEETFWEKPLNGYRFDPSRIPELDAIAASRAMG